MPKAVFVLRLCPALIGIQSANGSWKDTGCAVWTIGDTHTVIVVSPKQSISRMDAGRGNSFLEAFRDVWIIMHVVGNGACGGGGEYPCLAALCGSQEGNIRYMRKVGEIKAPRWKN